MSYKYQKMRRYSSDIHVLTFSPNEFRLDVSIGKRGRLERLSKIEGEKNPNEYTLAKINGGFFAMNGSTEFIGTFVDEGLYYRGSAWYYPTLVYWKKDNKLKFELHPTQSRCSDYQKDAWFAIGVPWTLIVNGKIDYTYTRSELIKAFGHPYQRHPRTLIGQKGNGDIVWVVADGRRATSRGIDITQSAQIMFDLGCVTAANLDGGGSSEMIVNNKIVNRPSDSGHERSIGTAFLAYGKKNISTGNTTTVSFKGDKKKAITTASILNVRSGPGTKYNRLGTLVRGSTIYVVSEDKGWCQIIYGNGTAYVSKSYVSYNVGTPATKPTTKLGTVTASVLNVRSGPSTSYSRIGKLARNSHVSIHDETNNGWYKITFGNGYGYVCSRYVK